MWAIIEIVVVLAIILISITEFFIPLILGKPLFGSFRKVTAHHENKSFDNTLDEKISKAKEKVNEVKDIQNEVNKNFKSAEKIKEESDNLLK